IVEARLPGAELVRAAGVGEREHRLEVADLLELLERLAAHPLGRGVGRPQLGVLVLEPAQLVEESVVRVVADLGGVENVVAAVVMGDLAPELLGALRGLGGAHEARSVALGSASRNIASRSQPRSRPRPLRSVRSKCTGVIEIRPRATAA